MPPYLSVIIYLKNGFRSRVVNYQNHSFCLLKGTTLCELRLYFYNHETVLTATVLFFYSIMFQKRNCPDVVGIYYTIYKKNINKNLKFLLIFFHIYYTIIFKNVNKNYNFYYLIGRGFVPLRYFLYKVYDIVFV